MYISENLRRLRRRLDMTQEKLAEAIGIVPQAVSKWERGEGLPDITLIPSIATALNVTIDELFGMDEVIRKKRIKEVMDEANRRLFADGNIKTDTESRMDFRDSIAYLREQLKDMPTAWELWFQLASFLHSYCGFGTDNWDRKKTDEALDILERIAERCTEMDMRNRSIIMTANIYASIGEEEKAKKHAKLLASKGDSYEHNAWCFLRGRELKEFLENELAETVFYINTLAQVAAGDVGSFGTSYADHMGTLEERLDMLELSTKTYELIKDKPWGGIWASRCCNNCYNAAQIMLEQGETERAFEYLERAASYCEPIPGEKRARIAFHRPETYVGETENIIPTEVARKGFIEQLNYPYTVEDNPFYPLRDNPRYITLLKRMKSLEPSFAASTYSP